MEYDYFVRDRVFQNNFGVFRVPGFPGKGPWPMAFRPQLVRVSAEFTRALCAYGNFRRSRDSLYACVAHVCRE